MFSSLSAKVIPRVLFLFVVIIKVVVWI